MMLKAVHCASLSCILLANISCTVLDFAGSRHKRGGSKEAAPSERDPNGYADGSSSPAGSIGSQPPHGSNGPDSGATTSQPSKKRSSPPDFISALRAQPQIGACSVAVSESGNDVEISVRSQVNKFDDMTLRFDKSTPAEARDGYFSWRSKTIRSSNDPDVQDWMLPSLVLAAQVSAETGQITLLEIDDSLSNPESIAYCPAEDVYDAAKQALVTQYYTNVRGFEACRERSCRLDIVRGDSNGYDKDCSVACASRNNIKLDDSYEAISLADWLPREPANADAGRYDYVCYDRGDEDGDDDDVEPMGGPPVFGLIGNQSNWTLYFLPRTDHGLPMHYSRTADALRTFDDLCVEKVKYKDSDAVLCLDYSSMADQVHGVKVFQYDYHGDLHRYKWRVDCRRP